MAFLFGKDLATLIIDEIRPVGGLKKTQTRRADDKNEFFQKVDGKISVVYTNKGREKWRVGNIYAVKVSRLGGGIAKIRITGIRLTRFCDISSEDVTAEGFASRDDFFDRIESLYKNKLLPTQSAWAITFEYVKNSYKKGSIK